MNFSATACLAALLLSQPLQTASPQPQSTTPQQAAQAPAPQQESRPPVPGTLLDGTAVKLKLDQTLSSSDAHTGDHVSFEVLEEVDVDGIAVIPKGSAALGTVTAAEHKKSMGRAGKLDVNIDSVRLADNEKCTLRATKDEKGGGHVGAMTTAMVATAIVFFPAAPLFLFIHGKDITIPQGTEITAFVAGDMKLDMPKFQPQPVAAAAPTVPADTGIKIDSSVPNADITVDGNFMGNTPAILNLSPGKHDISISKNGYETWTRSVTVSSGSMHISAELQPTAPK
jgi:hypothetical protein